MIPKIKLKKEFKLAQFAMLMSLLNFLLFHFPFYSFVFKNIELKSFNGILNVVLLSLLMLLVNAFVFYLVFYISRVVGKTLLILFFTINAICVYFINTYGVIIDESMIGNVLNTKYQEASSFFSFKLVLYIIVLAIIPALYIIKLRIIKTTLKRFLITSSLSIVLIILLAFADAGNWLWIDNNSKTLGGLSMPWSYTVNLSLFYAHKNQENEKETLLPDATITDTTKSVVVLVIGESARSKNFSLYGYNKNTNPLLSKTPNVFHFEATSCATYTTAGVKCILEDKDSDELYEILPNYLYRNGVDVIWRTTNWGEPPVHIKNYESGEALTANCNADDCNYDGVLMNGLKEKILASTKNKILIVLHTSTSHGPTYSKKYPSRFEIFKPVCNSVELGNCSINELMNAYDNTIVYTDYLLYTVIDQLKQLKNYHAAMMFVSDHGESLGEKNLYMHGLPKMVAPEEQLHIPFIVWMSDSSKQVKSLKEVSQHYVFHSTLKFLGIQSPVYNEEMNIFK